MTHNEKIDNIVDSLGCSIAEAEQIIADDKAIDKGERMPFDLTKEQEKAAMKLANVKEHKKPAVYKWDKKTRKENPTKKELIEFIKTALDEYADLKDLTVVNAERQISFGLGDEKFELTLVQKRRPKVK